MNWLKRKKKLLTIKQKIKLCQKAIQDLNKSIEVLPRVKEYLVKTYIPTLREDLNRVRRKHYEFLTLANTTDKRIENLKKDKNFFIDKLNEFLILENKDN